MLEIDLPNASTVGAIKDIALPIPIKARVKTPTPNITLGLLKALPIDLKPAPMPVKADCIALPFTNCNNNNAGIAGVNATKANADPATFKMSPNEPFPND
jgi:hypothetical protein